jgi:MFS family permease
LFNFSLKVDKLLEIVHIGQLIFKYMITYTSGGGMDVKSKSSVKSMAWMMWSLASLFVFYKFIIEVSPNVLKSDISSYFVFHGAPITESWFGFFVSVYYFAYGVMQLPLGLLLDRFGAKRVLLMSLLLCLSGTLVLGYLPSNAFYLACLARFVTGLGAASAIIGCMKLISVWFKPRDFAKMTGLMMTVGMMGAGFSEMMVESIKSTFHVSWASLYTSVGLLGLVLWLMYFLFIQDGFKVVSGNNASGVNASKSVCFKTAFFRVVSCRQSWFLSLYSGLMFCPVAAFTASWGTSFFVTVDHFSKAFASSSTSFILFGFALGSPFWGWLSDVVFVRKKFLIMCSLVTFCLSAVMILFPIHSVWILSSLCFFFGFFISAFVLSFSMIREINPLDCAATSIGFMNSFNALMSFLIVLAVGMVIDWVSGFHFKSQLSLFEPFHLGMSLILVSIFIAILLLPYLKETHCKQSS